MDEGKLFSDIRFNVAQCNNQQQIKDILIEGGAKHINYLSDDVTLVIADENCPEAEEAIDLFDKPVVSSLWVHLSLKANKLLPTEAFSPIKKFFQHVIASFSTDLSKNDVDILAATLTFYGGRVSKDVAHSTHFIAPSAETNDLPDKFSSHNKQLKVVAPDWILESMRLRCCCEEHLYDPILLLPPPPPTPTPPPPPPPPQQIQQPADIRPPDQRNDSQLVSNLTEKETLVKAIAPEPNSQPAPKNDSPIQPATQPQSYPSQPVQQLHTMPPSQLPRARAASNLIRGAQPKFRPLLPPNHTNVPISGPAPQNRMMSSEVQQPKKVTISYGQYRKMAPYQNNADNQTQTAQIQPQPPQHISIQQPTGNMTTNRLPQPNMYHQIRGPYSSNHIGQRAVAQPPMLNHQQQQPQQQTQMINRFQDPNSHINQRPYQVCLQPQQNNSNYQPNNMHRPSIYYTQNSQVRIPQQGPPMRIMHTDQVPYDGFNTNHHPNETLSNAQQPHYQQHIGQPQPPQSLKSMAAQQPQPQQAYPHSSHQSQQKPPIIQNRPQFQLNFSATTIGANQVKTARNLFNNQQETKNVSVRLPGAQPNVVNQSKPIRMPSSNLPQPHPSIFDHIQESNLAQIKAKVPIVEKNIDYFGHNPKDDVPSDLPFVGCRFKFTDYEGVNPRLKEKWSDAIRAAGGSFCESLEDLTHLICENRLSDLYSAAQKLSIRCVTIYWINDILERDRLTYPWKALHLPVPFSSCDKPLSDQIIAISNFKGRERREVREMIVKTGAKFTEYFSPSNSLIICGQVGGEKYERAMEWRIPIANCHILSDILLNSNKDFNIMLSQSKYQLFNKGDQLKLSSYNDVRDLMNPWTKPISVNQSNRSDEPDSINGSNGDIKIAPISNEDSGIITGSSNNSDFDAINGKSNSTNLSVTNAPVANSVDETEGSENLSGNQKVSTPPAKEQSEIIEDASNNHIKTDDSSKCAQDNVESKKLVVASASLDVDMQIDQVGDNLKKTDTDTPENKEFSDSLVQTTNSLRKSTEPVRLLLTHLDSSLSDRLKSYATSLNLAFAGDPTNCTHLIVDRISRTSKFICAFSHASYILSYKWLVESQKANNLLEEKHFIIQDKEGEEKFSFNLVYSLLRRRRRGGLLFKDFIFFVTPSVQLNVSHLKEMIESAGGIMVTRKLPTKLQIDQMKFEGKRFVIVSCDQDIHLCSTLELYGIDIVNVEFVISGILRQDIDFEAHRTKATRALFIRPETITPAQISQPSPPKKLRLDDSAC